MKAKKATVKKRKNLNTEDRGNLEEYIIRQAAKDPNVFTETVLRDESLELLKQGEIHIVFQDFISEHTRGIVIFPREHGKTTQMIARAAWEIGNNPEIRIKIISSSDNIATGRTKAIRALLQTPLYQRIFPHIEPGREWADSKFSVKRKSISPESTMEGYGIRSLATGGRADLLFFDDPDDEEVAYSEAKRRRNVDRVDNVWLNLLSPTGRAYLFCTPWHDKDISHTRSDAWPILKFPILDMVPVWAERWNYEKLSERRKDIGSIAFARGFELLIISSRDAKIKGHWFRYWEELPGSFDKLIIACDLAVGENQNNDYCVFGAMGLSKGLCYLVAYIRERMDFPTQLKTLKLFASRVEERFGVKPVIGIENVAYQRALPQSMKGRGSNYPIVELKAEKNKAWRAEKLGIHVENGRVLLRGENGVVHPEQRIFYDECTMFPALTNDDTLDMLGYGVNMLLGRRRATIIFSNNVKRGFGVAPKPK
ncbi:MAG: hypothetical protein V3U84_07590 [Thiotrichaceae bacterium]